MNIEKSVNRIKWRIENGGWKSNQKDVDSLNEIVKYVNAKETEQFDNNELFAKLYIHLFSELRKKYENPIKELHNLLKYPLGVHIQNLTSEFNNKELENFFDELKFSKKHPATISKEIKDKETDVLQEAVKDKRNEDRLFGNVWKPELVREIILNQINTFLNKYNHD